MASNMFVRDYADNTSRRVRRAKKQGRTPNGLGKEREIRLYPDSDAAFIVLQKVYGEYWNVNQFVRDAVRVQLSNSPYAELLNT